MLNKSHLFYAILCWIFFFLLNSLLFCPAYVIDCQLHPAETGVVTDAWWQPFLLGNYNIFYQLCGDFLLLLLPVLLLKKEHWLKKVYLPIAALSYLFLLYYNIYLEGYKGMYSVHPIFENDWVIIQEVLPTFLREISVKGSTYLGGFLGFLVLSVLIFMGMIFLQNKFIHFRKKPLFWGIGIVVSILGFFGLPDRIAGGTARILEKSSEDRVETRTTDTTSIANHAMQGIHWIYPDIQVSATLDREDHLKHLGKRWIYDFYKQKQLVEKPNIFLLFVESYGGVAAMSDYCEAPYDSLTTVLSQELASAGWSIASNYSKSTVIGGRSWLAMTTAIIGARIEDQIQYSELINKRQRYPHMVDFFNEQGYETFRVSSMKIEKAKMDTMSMMTIPNRFWKFDHRYFFPDIPYTGYSYDFYGGIPDQYTLSWATDELLTKTKKPTFYTAITMNSHGPWHYKMPPIVEDWRTLNDIKKPFGEEEIGKDMRIFSYWTAMEYQLKMLTHYIKNKGQDNSIYILIGDHNPAGLEYKLFNKFNKWATPIHIISKDSTFVQSFHQHGFTEGMKVDTSQYTIMRHMGLYSLLTRQLLENYGEEEEVLPDYLPWGL